MFQSMSKNELMNVGERNAAASRAVLKSLNIPLLAADTGANYGRTVTFFPETGEFHIRAVGRNETII